ncbi:MAG: hypothetical protein Q4B25_07415 [Pseudomonadota bacterium]|nr:hypothetical protein [Pseudomonadota bacterium]
MKYFCMVSICFFLFACRPVHVTKQYYDEHVNPVASIDYEDAASADIPAVFLDNYYLVDSRLVRLLDQLDLGGESPDSSWIDAQKAGHPWIEFMALLDNDLLFVSGDEYLGYDAAVRNLLEQMGEGEKRIILKHDGRCLLVHASQTGPDRLRTVVVEINVDRVMSDSTSTDMFLAVNEELVQHPDKSESFAPLLKKLGRSRKYSGRSRVDGQRLYWIRSMAADNLVYLYRG